MKIVIAYPPLESRKGVPQVSQNRQFQYTAGGLAAYAIYPVVPAYGATMLKQAGHQVYWLDGVVKKWDFDKWIKKIKKIKADLLIMESKAPVIKKHWKIINKIKSIEKLKGMKVVLVGDHVTALPLESFKYSRVDYVLTGGDWDFLCLNLCEHLAKGKKLEPGIYKRNKKAKPFLLNHNLEKLPLIDRDLTQWDLYAYKNSNFYRVPGAYSMFGRDCWWGKCSFCSWTTLYPGEKYRIFSVSKAISEVKNLVEKYQVKEIMDDSGTFANGQWLRDFCNEMIKNNLHKKVRINCNMRFNAGLNQADYDLMGKAGFRFVLYGLESANQNTLDKLCKNSKVNQIEPVLKMAKKAGLKPHITVMVGYPWEGKKEIKNTTSFVKSLFKKGLVNTMQATIVIPYPGTPLFKECKKKNLLKTLNWDHYDMRYPVMKSKLSDKELLTIVKDLYSSSIWNKTFMLNTLKQLNSWDGIKYVAFQAFKYLGKLWEFN